MTMPLTSREAMGDGKAGTARGAAGWLSLAAAPSFALMALVTGLAGGAPAMLCMHDASMGATGALGGMGTMYLLMSVFHLPAWLRLIAGRRGDAR
jgi:hypothetical protein